MSGGGDAAPVPKAGVAHGGYNPGDRLKTFGVAGPMKPDLARLAIATGMRCDFVPGGQIKAWPAMDFDGKRVNEVDLALRFTQSPASMAAESQYWTSQAVTWDGQPELTTTIYEPYSGRLRAPGIPMFGGDYTELSSNVLVPAADLQNGAVIVVDSQQSVESRDGTDDAQTVSSRICGAFRVVNGTLDQVAPPADALPGTITTNRTPQPWPVA